MDTIIVVRFENIDYGAIFMNMSNHRYYIRISNESEIEYDLPINAVCLSDGTATYIGKNEKVGMINNALITEN